MDFLFSSKVDVEFDKALDAAFDRLEKMSADAFVQQALMRSGGAVAGLSAAAIEGPGAFNTIKLSFYFHRESEGWFDHHFSYKAAELYWPGSCQGGFMDSFEAANDEIYQMPLAA